MDLGFGYVIQQDQIEGGRAFLELAHSLDGNFTFLPRFDNNFPSPKRNPNLLTKPKEPKLPVPSPRPAIGLEIPLKPIIELIIFQVVQKAVIILHLFFHELMEDLRGVVLGDVVEDVGLD